MSRPRALVTGASSGIGYEFARQLATAGYSVIGVARSEDKLQTLVNELDGDGHEYLVADLSSAAGQQAVCDKIGEQHLDLLVNNAGLTSFDPFYSSPAEKQHALFAVDCESVVKLSHAFLKQSHTGDALVNVSSVVGFLPTPAQAIYSGSKAFSIAFSECLHEEHRKRGVYVMALCPGLTRTEFITNATGGEADGSNMPESMFQSTEAVVSEAMQGLKRRGKAVLVTGWVNRLMLLLPRVLTRHRLLKILAVMGDPEKQL